MAWFAGSRMMTPVSATAPRSAGTRAQQSARAPLAAPTIVAFDDNLWRGQWMNRQEILSRLGTLGWPVIYSNGALSLWERHLPCWREAGLFSRCAAMDGVTVDHPGRLVPRWPAHQPLDSIAVRVHASRLRRAAQRLGTGPPIAFIFHPRFGDYAKRLKAGITVFHIRDFYPSFPGWTRRNQEQLTALAESADLLLAAGEEMLSCVPAAVHHRVRMLANGTDTKAYSTAADEPCPDDLAAISRPRIGYVGSINPRLDFDLIDRLSAARPDWQWVFVGPLRLPSDGFDSAVPALWLRCLQRHNVHWLGEKTHDAVPPYVAHMDLNVLPYRVDDGAPGWVRYTTPLKLPACLATGRPVVGAALASVQRFAAVVEIASGLDGWRNTIDRVLSGRGNGSAAARTTMAARNDWDDRVATLSCWLAEICSERSDRNRFPLAAQGPDASISPQPRSSASSGEY